MTKGDAQVGSFLRGFFFDLLPVLSILFLAVLTTIPLGFPGTLRMGGLFPLIGLIYWTLVRRKKVPPVLTFFLGLFTDVVTFSPIGLHAFIFVLIQSIILRQRRFLIGQGFWMMWFAFALVTTGFLTVTTALQFVFTQAVVPLRDVALAGTIGWASMPIVLWALSLLHDLIDLFDEPIA